MNINSMTNELVAMLVSREQASFYFLYLYTNMYALSKTYLQINYVIMKFGV